jgi:hypothetical protein
VSDLDALARKWGTDKSSEKHGYTWIYERIFRGFERPTLLEIGIKEGRSLRMWEEFFPGGRIHGLDLNPAPALVSHLETRQGDQSDASVLRACIEAWAPFDIVLDDGSHRWEHQIASLEVLFPALRPGGLYVIEDLQTSYRAEFGTPGAPTAVEYLTRLIEPMNGAGRVKRARDVRPEGSHPVAGRVRSLSFFPFAAVLEKA